MMFLIMAVAVLANPLRHFEVYLGQWSISGPGRAFRIIPMLDGKNLYLFILWGNFNFVINMYLQVLA